MIPPVLPSAHQLDQSLLTFRSVFLSLRTCGKMQNYGLWTEVDPCLGPYKLSAGNCKTSVRRRRREDIEPLRIGLEARFCPLLSLRPWLCHFSCSELDFPVLSKNVNTSHLGFVVKITWNSSFWEQGLRCRAQFRGVLGEAHDCQWEEVVAQRKGGVIWEVREENALYRQKYGCQLRLPHIRLDLQSMGARRRFCTYALHKQALDLLRESICKALVLRKTSCTGIIIWWAICSN